MSHISANITSWNAPIVGLSGTVDVPFILPAGGDTAKIDLANRKVSVNGRLLATAGTTMTIVGNAFHITNRENAPWPPVSSIVVECPYPTPASELVGDIAATLADHEARITDLETP